MVGTKKYELVIYYKNGETDYYYSRLTGKYWESDAESNYDALDEMKSLDPSTFDAIAECENVAWYVVCGPLFNDVV